MRNKISVDIIIPCYKSKNKLYASLFSIGLDEPVHVILVDDGANDNYDEIISMFQPFFSIEVIYLDKNYGPGIARNYGIDAATHDYIIFLDCGDVFVTPHTIRTMIDDISKDPEIYMISYAHLEEESDTSMLYTAAINNRFHGKIYKRTFLKLYDLKCNPACPRINEDIGFNTIIRYLQEDWKKYNTNHFINDNEIATVAWKYHKDSIVRSNKCIYSYAHQGIGLALNSYYSMNKALDLGVDIDIIKPMLCEHMAFLYTVYISTMNVRPECQEAAWAGPQWLYNHIFDIYHLIDPKIITLYSQKSIQEIANEEGHPFNSKLITYTFVQFLADLEKKRVANISYDDIIEKYVNMNNIDEYKDCNK